MGVSYSDLRRDYYNQISRRRRMEALAHQNYYSYNDNDLEYSNNTNPYYNRDHFDYDPCKYVENYNYELRNETLYLENLLHTNTRGMCYGTPPKAKATTRKIAAQSDYFRNMKIYPFQSKQLIKKIRLEASLFKDFYFPPQDWVLGNVNSQFMQSFTHKNQMKWERTKVIAYYKGTTNEFVLDPNGKPLLNYSNLSMRYFSVGDIFQGSLGSCFFLAVLLGITRNLELISHVMPLENASKSNIKKGAFNFRFWRLGYWFDLVIDDYLIVDYNHNVLFARNLSFQNEYWMCLIEKAFAK